MSVPRNKPLLSPTEIDRLKNPPSDANIRKRNNLIVKDKIKRWLNDANEVCLALDLLKNTKIEEVFPDENIFALFKATENLLSRLHFMPVEGEPQHPYIHFTDFVTTKTLVRRAVPSDLERNYRVQKFVEFLKQCYNDPYPKKDDPGKASPAYKKYYKKKEYQEMKRQAGIIGMRIPRMWDGEDMETEEEEPPK